MSSGTDARSAKATDETAGDTVPDEEGEDDGERKVFLFSFSFFDFFHTVHSPQQSPWGQRRVAVVGKQGCNVTTVQGNNVVFKQNA